MSNDVERFEKFVNEIKCGACFSPTKVPMVMSLIHGWDDLTGLICSGSLKGMSLSFMKEMDCSCGIGEEIHYNYTGEDSGRFLLRKAFGQFNSAPFLGVTIDFSNIYKPERYIYISTFKGRNKDYFFTKKLRKEVENLLKQHDVCAEISWGKSCSKDFLEVCLTEVRNENVNLDEEVFDIAKEIVNLILLNW